MTLSVLEVQFDEPVSSYRLSWIVFSFQNKYGRISLLWMKNSLCKRIFGLCTVPYSFFKRFHLFHMKIRVWRTPTKVNLLWKVPNIFVIVSSNSVEVLGSWRFQFSFTLIHIGIVRRVSTNKEIEPFKN